MGDGPSPVRLAPWPRPWGGLESPTPDSPVLRSLGIWDWSTDQPRWQGLARAELLEEGFPVSLVGMEVTGSFPRGRLLWAIHGAPGPLSCSASEHSHDAGGSREGIWRGPAGPWGSQPWLGRICGAQGERDKGEPWWVAHLKWFGCGTGRRSTAQSLARGWLCSSSRMSRSAFSR